MGEAHVAALARTDLDRHFAARRRRDQADLHRGGADAAVVGVDVRAPDALVGRAAGRADVAVARAVVAAMSWRAVDVSIPRRPS